MPLTFAYGSNMDVDAMARRCPHARPIGVARLARHRFVITPQGYASVVRHPTAATYGLLWEATLADVRALDAYERVASGLYVKILQLVAKTGGGAARAIVYLGRGEGGRPQPGYLESVLAAARALALPPEHIKQIEAHAAPRAALAPAPRVRVGLMSPIER